MVDQKKKNPDSAREFESQVLKTMVLAKCYNHVMVPKGEHHANGKTESAVSENGYDDMSYCP